MKKFGTKIVAFSIPGLIFIIITSIFYYYSKLDVDSKLNEISEYECLLMGDSQIQRLNGELITKSTINIASSGEHYYFSYNKLKRLVKNKNHSINKVILGVSVHNFAPVYNRLFNLDFPEGKNSLIRYLYFIQLFDGSKFIDHVAKLPIGRLLLSVYSEPDWGGFIESNNANPTTEIIDTTFKMHFSVKNEEDKFSHSQREYLYKIDSLCAENNIDLIILSTPYHSKYKEKIKPEYYLYFAETLRNLKSNIHINFLSDKVDPNYMSDTNHLNKIGAKHYSEIIGKELKARMLNKEYLSIAPE